ncbi:MAG: galactokinase family protein, partial [Bacteroidota bacterium]
MPSVQERFLQQFAQTPKLFRAPGRINLIGEHIDYHDGYVFPAAVHFQLDFAVGPAEGETATLLANDLDRSVSYRL